MDPEPLDPTPPPAFTPMISSASMSLLSRYKMLFIGAGLAIVLLIGAISFAAFRPASQKKSTPEVIIPPTPAATPTPIVYPTSYPDDFDASKSVTPAVKLTPTITKSPLGFTIRKSVDEVHIKVTDDRSSFVMSATLLDSSGKVVTNQTGYKYTWTIDDESLVGSGHVSAMCVDGIQPPCPDNYYEVTGKKPGRTTIHIVVTHGTDRANADFPLEITEK